LTPALLPDGRTKFAGRYGKMGGGYLGNQGTCVTPDGHLYFNGQFSFRINAIFEVKPDGSLGRSPRLTDVLSGRPAQGGFTGAFIGPVQDKSGGLEIDQQGCLYVGLNVRVQGYDLPPALAGLGGTGAVVKFGPDGGAMLPDPAKVKPGAKYECYKNPTLTMPEKIGSGLMAVTRDGWAPGFPGKKLLEGALKAYPLLAPFSYEGCACQTPRFEVDDYAKLARLAHVSRARISQIMNLTLLAPDIQQAILFLPNTSGPRSSVCEREVRRICAAPNWRKQRRMWTGLTD
jgi:hypothetical protein